MTRTRFGRDYGHRYGYGFVSRRSALLLAATAAMGLTAAVASALPAQAAGSPAVARAAQLSSLFNNAGISDDANAAAANLDGGGYSFSAEALASVGWAPGLTFAVSDGAAVQVPNLAPGQQDNTVASGQTYALAGSGRALDFIVTSTDGNTSGTGAITYSDGSSQAYTLSVPDWWSGTTGIAAATQYRNYPGGHEAHQVSLYLASVPLNTAKTVASVTLPNVSSTTVNTAALHVFATALAPLSGPTGLSAAFDNVGITDNANTTVGNLDGTGHSLSAQDLAAAGWVPGARVILNGTALTWPNVPSGQPDNVVANGQQIGVPGSGNALTFVLASTEGTTGGSGTVTYTDGSTQSYSLSVPDWYVGPSDTMAVQLPDWNTPTGTQSATIKPYAQTVPLNPAKTVATVTLPTVSAAPGTNTPALHVFALGVRPVAGPWTGTWAAAADDGLVPGPWINRTLRMVAHSSVGGQSARIRLDNDFATAPVVIGHATIAVQSSTSTAAATPVTLTFNGNQGGVIPAGGQLVSDAVGFALPADTNLLVSLYLPGTVQIAPFHSLGVQDMYTSADQTGDQTADVANFPTSSLFGFWTLLSGIDVVSGTPSTVVAFGDSITDGYNSAYNGNARWPNFLARRLLAQSQYPQSGVVDEGISGNRILNDAFNGLAGTGTAGVSALAREDRDVLAQTNVKTLIILEGINDLNSGTSASQVISGLEQLAARAHAQGLRVLGGTITPELGAGSYTAAIEANRETVNSFIRSNGGVFDNIVDFDAAIRDPANPTAMLPAYDSGDHLHPSSAGYQAMANAVDLSQLG